MTESAEPADVEDAVEKARRIVDSRLLTQDEFKQIESRQMSKQLSVDRRVGRTGKRSRSIDDTPHQEFVSDFTSYFCGCCSVRLKVLHYCQPFQLVNALAQIMSSLTETVDELYIACPRPSLAIAKELTVKLASGHHCFS